MMKTYALLLTKKAFITSFKFESFTKIDFRIMEVSHHYKYHKNYQGIHFLESLKENLERKEIV